MTRRKYLRDSVTGKPYDPDTKQWLIDADLDSTLGDLTHQAAEHIAPPVSVPEPPKPEDDAPPAVFEPHAHNEAPAFETILSPDLFKE